VTRWLEPAQGTVDVHVRSLGWVDELVERKRARREQGVGPRERSRSVSKTSAAGTRLAGPSRHAGSVAVRSRLVADASSVGPTQEGASSARCPGVCKKREDQLVELRRLLFGGRRCEAVGENTCAVPLSSYSWALDEM